MGRDLMHIRPGMLFTVRLGFTTSTEQAYFGIPRRMGVTDIEKGDLLVALQRRQMHNMNHSEDFCWTFLTADGEVIIVAEWAITEGMYLKEAR